MSTAPTTDLVVANGAAKEVTKPEPPPQYARGFDGMATEPFPEDARKVLAAPVDPHDVEIKPDGIVFLPGVAYRRILTRAFGAGGWALAPRSPARVMGNIVIYHGALYCLGRFVAEAVGECFYREGNANMSYASCVEGAKTDALSRCCKDLGIATEMWDANWREKWKAQYAYQDRNDLTRDGKPKWKLKNRVSNPHDLMAGAGGVEPPKAPTAAASTAEPRTSATAPAEPPRTGHDIIWIADGDDGTAAEAGEQDAVRNLLKALKYKPEGAKRWMSAMFGVEKVAALTKQNCASATALLLARGQDGRNDDMYEKMLRKLQADGKVRG